MAAVACDMSFNTSLISEEQWWSPFPPTLSCWEVIVSETWKIRPYNTCSMCCPSWARHIARHGRGTHVTHFMQLYPQPLYTASQVCTTSRSWDKGVLTDLCLTLYISSFFVTSDPLVTSAGGLTNFLIHHYIMCYVLDTFCHPSHFSVCRNHINSPSRWR